MIRAFLFLLLAVLAGWFVADSMKQNGPGYILLYYNHYSIETSIWVGLLALVVLVLVIYLLIHLSQSLFSLSFRAWGFRNRKQREWFDRSVKALLAGDWFTARRLANRNVDFTSILLAARAALSAGNVALAKSTAQKASKLESADLKSLMLLHYDIEVAEKQSQAAFNVLQQLLAQFPQEPAVWQRAVTAYCREHAINELNSLLPTLLKKPNEFYQPLQKQLLTDAAACLINDAKKQRNLEALRVLWLKLGKSPARNSVLPLYCHALIELEQEKEARGLLLTRLEAQFDENCLTAYAQLALETSRQLNYLNQLDQQHPFNANIQLALGIVLLRDQQWDAARKAIEQSIALCPQSEAYRYLALYYERRGDERHARQSLLLGLDSQP